MTRSLSRAFDMPLRTPQVAPATPSWVRNAR